MRDRLRVNNRIRAREVRLIDEEGTQVGIITTRDALALAEERGLDLVEVAPTATPPVCRILDYGKYRYEQSKKERDARKNQKQVELKEVRLKARTDRHDLEVKTTQARRFLVDGDKVKFTVRFRGREIFHSDIGRDMLEEIATNLSDIALIEQRPLMEGRAISLLLAPNPKAAKQAQQQRERSAEPAPRERPAKPARPPAAAEAEPVSQPVAEAKPSAEAEPASPPAAEAEPVQRAQPAKPVAESESASPLTAEAEPVRRAQPAKPAGKPSAKAAEPVAVPATVDTDEKKSKE